MALLCSKLPGAGLDAEVHAASIGPPVAGGHDERVAQIAREMGIPLQPVGGVWLLCTMWP